ncbi:MAG TPA: response regulator [Chitinophagales bacterium]|nr:response regulator [Chitinophagales bacterium]
MRFKHFLILDDDPLSARLNQYMVQHSDAQLDVTTFHDPEACLMHIRNTVFLRDLTCMLLDLRMPKMDGWKFLKELEKMPVGIQNRLTVVIVTSSKDDEDLVRVQDHPLVAGYLNKPVTYERFCALLDHLDYRATA